MLAALLAGGCAAGNAAAPMPAAPAGPTGTAGPPAPAPRPASLATPGLLVLHWTVAADPGSVRSTLEEFADAAAMPPERSEGLGRNGLKLSRVAAPQLDDLERALGARTLDISAWHGQVYRWRPLRERPLGPGQTPITVDGRTRSLGPGTLVLLVRAWAVPLEDGPRLVLELSTRVERLTAPGLQPLLAGRRPPGEIFASACLEVQLETGFAYVLTGEPPAGEADDRADDPAAGEPAPPTPGELLFAGDHRIPTCAMVVLVPVATRPGPIEAIP